jgi:hypothetical protein
MRIVLRVFVILLALLVSFVIWRSAILTRSGELMWFVYTPSAIVLTNGMAGDALLHHCCESRIWILTRHTSIERESYAIIPPVAKRDGYVWRCDGWAAPRLPLFPYLVYWTDVPFDCDSDPAALTHRRSPSDRELQFGQHFVAFIADDGSSLVVRWE